MAYARIASQLSIGALALASIALPTAAQAGFFEQLFGIQQAPQPSYSDERPAASEPGHDLLTIRRHAARRAVDEKPVLQKTTDLMHDKTLRPGDAVMMKTGIHVYAGGEKATHSSDEFVSLGQARHVTSSERIMLASMETVHSDPVKLKATDTLEAGRSVAVNTPIVSGVQFTDVRGRTIRYVGP